MRPSTFPAFAVLASPLLFAPLASAYPIPPVNLWKLAEQADLIVVARVASVERRPSIESNEDHFGTDTAHLRVAETWKGDGGTDVDVAFGSGVICPAPAHYEAGATVLAFLARPDEKTALTKDAPDVRWRTVSLSYGSLYPRDEDLPILRDLVVEALALQSRGPVPEAARRAWHVRAATHRATRWHGLMGLPLPVEGMGDGDGGPGSPRRSEPAPDERREVLRGFADDPSDDGTIAMTLVFVGRQPDDAFDQAMLGQLERVLADDDIAYWLPDALARMAERFGSRDGLRAIGLTPETRYDEPKPAVLRAAWRSARARYGIPLVPAAPVPVHEKPGVGGRTPD
jgi:hypothetical protein